MVITEYHKTERLFLRSYRNKTWYDEAVFADTHQVEVEESSILKYNTARHYWQKSIGMKYGLNIGNIYTKRTPLRLTR